MNTPNVSEVPSRTIEYEPLENLLLDANNPRFGAHQDNEDDQRYILDHIVKTFGVDDVLSSLAVNGYFESEPLVCQKSLSGNKFIVKEGNRRLSACLIISGATRASNQSIRAEKFKILWEKHGASSIDPIPVIVFSEESEKGILSYLGVRHIASAQPWDSYAKAAWVAKVVEENYLKVPEIAQMIGAQYSTINQMLKGYYFVKQLERTENFQPDDSVRKGRGSVTEYPFSWVYTILGYQSVKEFLEMDTGNNKDASEKPLAEKNLEKGGLVLKSMFGNKSKGRNAAISDSRQIGALANVFADKEKVKLLEQGKNIEEIETLTKPIEQQLSDGLGDTRDTLRILIARLAEYGISQEAAKQLEPDSSRNRKLAIQLDKDIQDIASGNDAD